MNSSIKFNGRDIALDKNGYLIDHTDWTEALAERIAELKNTKLVRQLECW